MVTSSLFCLSMKQRPLDALDVHHLCWCSFFSLGYSTYPFLVVFSAWDLWWCFQPGIYGGVLSLGFMVVFSAWDLWWCSQPGIYGGVHSKLGHSGWQQFIYIFGGWKMYVDVTLNLSRDNHAEICDPLVNSVQDLSKCSSVFIFLITISPDN
ncbi:hypothetical protein BsWGS_18455 [Bradybaena similaris]